MTGRNKTAHRVVILLGTFALSSLLRADAVVTICNSDSGPAPGVNLKQAVGAGGHITFNCPAGTVISFSQLHSVSAPTQIDGGGNITFDGRGGQMFVVGGAIPFSLSGLTIQNARPSNPQNIFEAGVVTGGGLINIKNCTFSDNDLAISSAGSVTVDGSSFLKSEGTVIFARNIRVTNSTIRGSPNFPVLISGAGTVDLQGTSLIGGAGSTFKKPCALSIAGSKISSSTATAIVSECDTTISKSEFSSNHGQNGGALFLSAAAPRLQITGSSFLSNSAVAQGGAIAFEPTVEANRNLSFTDVSFTGNTAADGGAIHLGSSTQNNVHVVGKSLIFSKNTATATGGAIASSNASVTFSRAVFVDNTASVSGGAIDLGLFAPHLTIIANAIFTGNGSQKGSVFHGSGVHFVNVTIANSKMTPAISPFSQGADLNSPDPSRLISFRNVAFWQNAMGACETGAFSKLFQDAGHNLQFPAAGCEPTIAIADPKFDSMFIPAMGGPADGTGDLDACLATPVNGVDLYGRHRPQGKSCAIGAVEGDIDDVVLQRNPGYGKLPPAPPSNCQCGPSSHGCPPPPRCYPPNPVIAPSVVPTVQAEPPQSIGNSATRVPKLP